MRVMRIFPCGTATISRTAPLGTEQRNNNALSAKRVVFMSPCPDSPNGKDGNDTFAWCAALLYVLVMLVFLPTILFPFVTVDDPAYIYENANVSTGLSWANLV